MIVAECRGVTVVVEGVGPRDHLRVVRWPDGNPSERIGPGVKTREPESELKNERVIADADPDEG